MIGVVKIICIIVKFNGLIFGCMKFGNYKLIIGFIVIYSNGNVKIVDIKNLVYKFLIFCFFFSWCLFVVFVFVKIL